MAEYYSNDFSDNYRTYTEGNTVRKTAPDPRYAQEIRKEIEEAPRRESVAVRRNRERALSLSLPHVIILLAATVLVVLVCVGYLRVTTEINRSLKHITALEKELSSLKSDNQILAERIEARVDLEEVYELAVTRLGMVYQDDNERLTYTEHEREYVRQYEDVPIQ